MDQSQITNWTRRGIREYSEKRVSNTDIVNMTLEAIYFLGMKIKTLDPSFFNARKSISSNTHVFDKPSDFLTELKIWDMGTTALTVSGAADNGSGLIRLTTSADHGLSDAVIVQAHDVGGTTEADGIWQIDYDSDTMDADVFDLIGSTFSNAYTSGGKVFQVVESPQEIKKKLLQNATNNDPWGWYPRGSYIVVDDDDYTNDIILDYIKRPTAITDIPAEYHMGLVAFNVIHLITLPQKTNNEEDFFDRVDSKNRHKELLAMILNQINETFDISEETDQIYQELDLDAETIC